MEYSTIRSATVNLARLGVRDGHAAVEPLPHATFEAAAADVLPRLAEVVVDELLPELPAYSGTWHPTGFMVFPLGSHPTLGTLRLHVWPAGLRRRELKGRGRLPVIHDGDIHDHAWSVGSFVLVAYEDRFFSAAPIASSPGPLPADEFRVFTVRYGPAAHNALVTDGSCVRVSTSACRSFRENELHFIEPGVFHAPTVADDVLGATLVFSSPRAMAEGPRVLIGGSTAPIVGNRSVISAEDAEVAREQVAGALGCW